MKWKLLEAVKGENYRIQTEVNIRGKTSLPVLCDRECAGRGKPMDTD